MRPGTELTRSDYLRKPQLITPRIRPWLGGLLWIFSAAVVLVFGQLLFPQALVDDSTATRETPSVLVGFGMFAVVFLLHALYWWQVVRHMRAEVALYDDIEGGAAFYPLESRPFPFDPGATLTFASGLSAFVLLFIAGGLSLPKLGTSDNTDSPALALVFLLVCVLPFAAAMTAVGYLRLRRTLMTFRSGRLPF